MEHKIKISKLDAAKRQLETAIRLYFNSADPISIHTLACAAHNILADLTKAYKQDPMALSGILIKEECRVRLMRKLREPQNFFKHATEDRESTIDFNPDVNESFILDSCMQYHKITNEKVLYFHIFVNWFASRNIDFFDYSEEQKRVVLEIPRLFGDDKAAYFSRMLSLSGKLL